MDDRAQFERWITAAPYRLSVKIMRASSPWQGQYAHPTVQIAWEAWQRASRPSLELVGPGTRHATDWEQIVRGLMFASWWQAYPALRRAAKKQCWQKWLRLDWHGCLMAWHDVVFCERGARDVEWLRGYNPAPMVYINQARWEEAWNDADQERERDHGGHRVRDGGDVVARAIAANRRKLAGE